MTPCMGEDEGIEYLAFRVGSADFIGEVFLSRWENVAEMLAHEVGHALSLGIPIEGTSVSHPVAIRLRDISEHEGEHAEYRNEALTLASEDYVMRALGIPCERAILEYAAKNQMVPPAIFDEVWGSPDAIALGKRVMRYIGRRLMRRKPAVLRERALDSSTAGVRGTASTKESR